MCDILAVPFKIIYVDAIARAQQNAIAAAAYCPLIQKLRISVA